jgi:hypothetical protein
MRIDIAGGGYIDEFVARRLIREGNELVIVGKGVKRITNTEVRSPA